MNTAAQITDTVGGLLLQIHNGENVRNGLADAAAEDGLVEFVRGIDGMPASELTDEGREALASWLGAEEASELGLEVL